MHLNPIAIPTASENKHKISFTYEVKQFGNGPGKKPFLVLDSSLPPDSCSLLAALFCLKGSFTFFFNFFLFYIEV